MSRNKYACLTAKERESEGKNFRYCRLDAHMSIAEVARDLGVAWQTVKRFETGLRVNRRKLLVHSYRNLLRLEWTKFMMSLQETGDRY